MGVIEKDPARALDLARQAQDLRPEEPRAYMLQGHVHFRRWNLDSARENYLHALKRSAKGSLGDAQGHERLGRIAFMGRRYKAARNYYQYALTAAKRADPLDHELIADAKVGLGLCLDHLGDRETALRLIRQGAAHGPSEELAREIDERYDSPPWYHTGPRSLR